MEAFKVRLQEEIDQLTDRIDKLSRFINGSAFVEINESQQVLLLVQLDAMKTYHTCLLMRCKLLNM